MATLPPELCDRIIDFTHDDYCTLRACSLVCADWLPRSRHHLFSSLAVFQDADDVPKSSHAPPHIFFASLLAMLDGNPALKHHFATVRLIRTQNELVTQVLAALGPSRATTLHIDAVPDIFSHAPVDLTLSRDFTRLRSLALHHVLFETLDELVAQINPLRRLQHLDLRHIYIKIPHSGLPPSWSPPRHAGAAETMLPRFAQCDARIAVSDYSSESSLASLWPWLRASAPQLRVVALEANVPKPEGKRILPLLLTLHAQFLTSLSLRLRNCGEDDVVPPALAQCTNLVALSLTVSVACVRDPALPPPSPTTSGDFVRAAAQSMPPLPGVLRAFRLALLDVRSHAQYAWEALDGLPWHPDCACAVDLAFDTVGVLPPDADIKTTAERLVRRSLSRMNARGQLQVSVE